MSNINEINKYLVNDLSGMVCIFIYSMITEEYPS